MTLHPHKLVISGFYWEHTVRKCHINAINVIMHPFEQALWVLIWKQSGEKSWNCKQSTVRVLHLDLLHFFIHCIYCLVSNVSIVSIVLCIYCVNWIYCIYCINRIYCILYVFYHLYLLYLFYLSSSMQLIQHVYAEISA